MSAREVTRLRWNPTVCTGAGYCAEIVPELVSLDDWGFPVVDGRPVEDGGIVQHARRAAAMCPRLALLLEPVADESGGVRSTPFRADGP